MRHWVGLLACCEVEKMVVVMDETKAVLLLAQLAVWIIDKNDNNGATKPEIKGIFRL